MARTAVITGASGGIGSEVARELARRGWRIAVVGRNTSRTEEVARMVDGVPFVCDFDRLDDVRELAETLDTRYERIDAIVNNAGGIVAQRQDSADGHELTLQRNVLGAVVLTERLVPKLMQTRGRVIHTSSLVSRFGRIAINDVGYAKRRYGAGWWPYASAKLGVILYARSLAERTGLESYPVHPGYVRSGFGAESRSGRLILSLSGWMQISSEAGASSLVHAVDTPELGVPNGTYFDGLTPNGPTHPAAWDRKLITAYWRKIAQLTGTPVEHQQAT
ncbi:MAG: SDR family NAD(P)-dependent oxidoreductase [Pontimonas sp.]|jgi:NAD(P)-dependent dehydrogenase (short-subunit alcohol dehydrogenase family)|nr:SDR family NAD(P)-dependent oxidoreductase [Pontimonas sp.]|tara:strand:+ start:6426 stop:7256 length:831 start_codon:yes stop_codon:yes gene_type:complete